jgi:glycerol-3-phosphate dehydrogenase
MVWHHGVTAVGRPRTLWQADPMAGPALRRDEPSRRSPFSRSANLERLAAGPFDVLVIGGGITGAGVALDAASRGLTTALVEKADFASGTSSKSSKMIHGGIRYLQQREFRLVYENLAERQHLLDNAPHLVSPLPFLIPLFGHSGVVSKAVARSYSSALWLYDLTGGIRIGKRHQRVTRQEALGHFPKLDTDRLVAGFLYYDAWADDARLTLTVLRTAVDGYGATAANYTEVVGLLRDGDGTVTGATVRDREDPDAPAFEIRARAVVNATGVWTDEVLALDDPDATSSLRPAKGVHVTVPASRFPADVAGVIPVRQDHRSIFVVPWPETGFVYLGTTDTDYEGDLDDPRCTGEDVDYLLDAANRVSSAGLTRADVTGVWAGLRPLLKPASGRRISKRTADLSRRHKVWRARDGVVTITGGKLTTQRKMAEDTVDLVVKGLGEPARRCITTHLALEGSPSLEPTAAGAGKPDPPTHLQRRYGSRAGAVLALAADRPDLLEPIVDGLPYLGAEALYAVREEMAVHLGDVLARRTRAAIQDARAATRAATAVARIMAGELGWADDRTDAEVSGFVERVAAELAAAGVEATQPAAHGAARGDPR